MSENTQEKFHLLPLPLVRAVSRLLATARRLAWRAVSLLLTLTILLADPSWAVGVSDFLRVSFSSNFQDMVVPSHLGTISDRWVNPRPAAAHASPVILI